ncbi:Kunitz/Bovine pancreatic trypsin inhibitor domain protein [Ancylostoma ceylanicum]|uniref:Kunitz/Bovine pancreatic trypsin inhibitor domain protein n=1 Tax=Ancylostoma ceylanicum TaxID=53326 RepID=A0A0D6LNJ3_9BILA|nr:Kunitz/Bovine pancreatic trypsin inhibitor domain protein [Ancylostoma ceylanicum]
MQKRAAWEAYKNIEDVVKKARNVRLTGHVVDDVIQAKRNCFILEKVVTAVKYGNLTNVRGPIIEKICSLPPNPGYGDCSSEPSIKFYFDVYDLRCKKFLFLNCKGSNQNRFDTEEECIRVCHYTACRPGEIIALSNATTPIICEKPSQCPDGYRCSYDKLFRRHVCCGYSNLEYCPLGQALLNETLSEHPKKCNLMQGQFACPKGYECITPYRGNPWGYCCSTRIEARCPDGTEPYLYPENNQPQKCTVGVTTCRSNMPRILSIICVSNSALIPALFPIADYRPMSREFHMPEKGEDWTLLQTATRVGYSCQGLCNSIVGFCCTKKTSPSTDISNSDTTSDERPWYENATAHHANDGLVTKGD